MAHDIVGAPGAGAFVFEGPGCGEIAEEGVEGGGRAGEKGDCMVEVLVHWMLGVLDAGRERFGSGIKFLRVYCWPPCGISLEWSA